MKIRIIVGYGAVLIASGMSTLAVDTPAQAAARAALELKLQELDHPQSQPATVPPSWDVVAPTGDSTSNLTDTVHPPTLVHQPAPTAVIPVTAPVVVAPAPTLAPISTLSPSASASPKPAPAPLANQTASPPVIVKPPNDIVTIFGTVYKNAEVEKVESDGVIISYWTSDGGFAISKLDFKILPAELRNHLANY